MVVELRSMNFPCAAERKICFILRSDHIWFDCGGFASLQYMADHCRHSWHSEDVCTPKIIRNLQSFFKQIRRTRACRRNRLRAIKLLDQKVTIFVNCNSTDLSNCFMRFRVYKERPIKKLDLSCDVHLIV